MNSTLKRKKAGKATEGRQFLAFVGLAYVAQGIAQHFCLLAQPLDYFLLKEAGQNAAQVAFLLSLLMIPWMVKPVYGIMSDFLPLAGYRRKSYLVLAYACSSLLYGLAACTGSLYLLWPALFLTACALAMGTTIISGLVLAVGRPNGHTRRYQSFQAVCYYTANIFSLLVGGLLCSYLPPASALHTACWLASLPCLLAAFASWYWLREERAVPVRLDLATMAAGVALLRSRGLFVVTIFLCFWHFSPGFGTPLYFHETRVLGFSQLFIGQLGAVNSVGMIAGALLFRFVLEQKLSPKHQAVLAVLTGTISTISYLSLASPLSAVVLEFFRGLANILAILTVYGLVADVSPPKLESTAIALLISAFNVAEQLGNNLGAYLYVYVFGNSFGGLVAVSAMATLACIFIVPWLPEEDRFSS